MGKQARRLLEAAMARAGMDGKDCAKAMNLSLAAFYRKMNGHVGWTTWQARLLCEVLGIKDLAERAAIFLND